MHSGLTRFSEKIDNATTNGLLGVADSASYRIEEIEKHFHTREFWRGKKTVQGATDWFDDVLTPFVAKSGANVYGADADDEAKCVGSGDTPVQAGYIYFDFHRLLVIGVSEDTIYKLRVVWGTGTMADAITAGQTTEITIQFDSANPQQSAGVPIDTLMPRILAGTKVWVQAWNAVDNATISFLIGFHEYAG